MEMILRLQKKIFVIALFLLSGCSSKPDLSQSSLCNAFMGEKISYEDQRDEINSVDDSGQSQDSIEKTDEFVSSNVSDFISKDMECMDKSSVIINAKVIADNMNIVTKYRYIPLLDTEELRKIWFRNQFFSETWDVNQNALYDAEESTWEINTPIGYLWKYQCTDSITPKEPVLNLENTNVEIDYSEVNNVFPTRFSDEDERSHEEMMICDKCGCYPSSIASQGGHVMKKMGLQNAYSCCYIHICGKDSKKPYTKALFRRIIDGIPVTVWHNLSTITEKGSHSPCRIWGSIYSVEEIGLNEPILTAKEAVNMICEQMNSVYLQEDVSHFISLITLEYLSVVSEDDTLEIVPIWRFWLGSDDIERSLLSESILAINAVNGKVIWERRTAFMNE